MVPFKQAGPSYTAIPPATTIPPTNQGRSRCVPPAAVGGGVRALPGRFAKHTKIHCKMCGVLLAKLDETGLTIRRGGLQSTTEGRFRTTLVCYHCKTLNIIRHSTEE